MSNGIMTVRAEVRGQVDSHYSDQLEVPRARLKCSEWIDQNGEKAILSMSKRFGAAVALHCSCPQRALFSRYTHSCRFYVLALLHFREAQIRQIGSMMSRVVLRRPWIKARFLAGTFYLLGLPRSQSLVSQLSRSADLVPKTPQ